MLPERPFSIEFWDGGRVPATAAADADVLSCAAPSAIAHALRAPGPLGLGRAYVEGSLETDDIDGAFLVVDDWVPPPIAAARQGAAARRARARGAPGRDPAPAGDRAAAARRAPQPGARRGGDPLPLRRRQRVLRAVPRRVDDLQLRAVLARRADARGGAARQARHDRAEARAARRAARARRRLRLGELRDPRRARIRRRA